MQNLPQNPAAHACSSGRDSQQLVVTGCLYAVLMLAACVNT